MGSSDGAVPGPMGLSVVIRLGCPRKVRVMVVGTFKPEKRCRVFLVTPLFLFLGSFFHTEHALLGLPPWPPPQLGHLHPISHSERQQKRACVLSASLGDGPPTAESLRVDAKTLVEFNSIPSPCEMRRPGGRSLIWESPRFSRKTHLMLGWRSEPGQGGCLPTWRGPHWSAAGGWL